MRSKIMKKNMNQLNNRGWKMSLLTVKDLSQSFIDKTLYEDANFVLNKEDHMGVTGQNGVGKSTLICMPNMPKTGTKPC